MITLCKDKLDQVLYITEPYKNNIHLIMMKEHHIEDCFNEVERKKEEIVRKMERKLLLIFQSHGLPGGERQEAPKAASTRMKKFDNFVSNKLRAKSNDELVYQAATGDEKDSIEVDINTQ